MGKGPREFGRRIVPAAGAGERGESTAIMEARSVGVDVAFGASCPNFSAEPRMPLDCNGGEAA